MTKNDLQNNSGVPPPNPKVRTIIQVFHHLIQSEDNNTRKL